jgi:mTERF
MPEIQQLILKQPALLQYNIEKNIRPKLNYLRDSLQIPPVSITKMLLSNPTILGRSLDGSIVPVVQGLTKAFGLSLVDVGAIFVQVPTLLGLNWATNMEPKVAFLQGRLGLSQAQVQQLLRRTPRILVHSVEGSLGPKLQLLQEASKSQDTMSKTVFNNPSILLSSMNVLKQKIALSRRGNATIENSFSPRGSDSTSNLRQKKSVMEISEKGEIIQRHPNIQVAAEAAGTSVTNMYSILNKRRVFNGKIYEYGSADKLPIEPPKPASTGESAEHLIISHPQATSTGPLHSDSTAPLEHIEDKVNNCDKLAKDIKRHYIPEDNGSFRLLDALREPLSLNSTDELHIVMFVAGSSYPPEKAGSVRGLRKAGGLSVYFPQADGFAFGRALRSAAENVVSQIMPPKEDGTMFCEGMVCLGYPYVKASRNRCSLYACLNALRILQELLMLERLKCSEMKDTTVNIDIFTDSKYAWSLLHNTDKVLKWGSNARKEDFVFDGTLSVANADILYPLSRVFYRLVEQDFVPTKDGRSVPSLAGQLNVSFHHKSEAGIRLEARLFNDKAKSITDYAIQAAQWQYERIRVA